MAKHEVREVVKAVYPKSKRWAVKIDRMTDAQIVAIYMRLKLEGKLK